MQLQISFDMIDLDKALEVAHQVHEYADILEIGALLIYAHGITAVERFSQAFPEKTVLADTNIVDHGKESAELFSRFERSWITVMAGTPKNVIHAACTQAHASASKVMLDLIDSKEYGQSALEAKNLGADALLVHEAYDNDQQFVFMDKWEMIRGNTDLPIYISAHITRENIEAILKIKPDGIVVGRAITQADDPKAEAQFFYELIKK